MVRRSMPYCSALGAAPCALYWEGGSFAPRRALPRRAFPEKKDFIPFHRRRLIRVRLGLSTQEVLPP